MDLQEQPDALANPWQLTVQELNRSPRALPANTHIAQVYDQTDPGNYSRFLDYAAERILLRKVGGGYIFVHHLLLDYFATLKKKDF